MFVSYIIVSPLSGTRFYNTQTGIQAYLEVHSMAKKKKQAAQPQKARSATEQAVYNVAVPEEIIRRAEREFPKETYWTPFKVAQKYNMTISSARKLLKIMEEKGVIALYTRNSRSPVYVPKR
jgi:small subunit ribosomal protein S25e